MKTRLSLAEQLVNSSSGVVAEVEHWTTDEWRTPCEVHGEASDATRLALHIAARSRHVVGVVGEGSEPQPATPGKHSATDSAHVRHQDVITALRTARDEALAVIRNLDDQELERLHESNIDGEPDVLTANCGLIGHWTFHLPAVQQIRRSG